MCLFSLFLLRVFVCVCVRPTNDIAANRIYTAQTREQKEERTKREEERWSICKSRARSADVGARLRRAPRKDKAGGVARRLTPLPSSKSATERRWRVCPRTRRRFCCCCCRLSWWRHHRPCCRRLVAFFRLWWCRWLCCCGTCCRCGGC